MSEKGEWRLVTAEGCEDGSGVAFQARNRDCMLFYRKRFRVVDSSDEHQEVKIDSQGVAKWKYGGALAASVVINGPWYVFHPAPPQPLTHKEATHIIGQASAAGIVDADLRNRPLPEFPRRIPFAKRLPGLGVQVVYSTVDGDVMLGFRTGPTGAWMKTGCYTTDTDVCLWWHPIAGPDAGDDE